MNNFPIPTETKGASSIDCYTTGIKRKKPDVIEMADFSLDGTYLDEGFTHTANGSATISYGVQMFANDTLSWDTHTFTILNGYGSLAIFDYMDYT